MKIRIVDCKSESSWYGAHIGEEFTVSGRTDENLILDIYGDGSVFRMADPNDCEVLPAPRCPHCGGVLEEG